MSRLAYCASRICADKPNWFETQEGYRIYRNTVIARSGSQEYIVREIKNHPDFNPEWGLNDDAVITLYRPVEVVTAPVTLAGFEGKSVTDEHPDEDPLVMVETEDKYGRGHIQNVRVGEALECGEITLIADLFVKNQELNDKIDQGIREVSCGYTFRFTCDELGNFVVTKISGNHLAVVPRGRAGSEVAIRDAAVEPSIRENPAPEEKKERKPMTGNILGRMLKAFAADANPDELAEAVKLTAARDADKDEDMKEDKKEDDKSAARDAEATEKLMSACDKLTAAVDALTAKLAAAKDADEAESKEVKEEKKDEVASDDADVLDLDGEEKGDHVMPTQIGDAAALKAFMQVIRPAIAQSGNKVAKDAFNAHVRALKGATAVDSEESVYASLVNVAAHDAAGEEDVDPKRFFNGVRYAEGLKRYQEHLATKGNK